MIIFTYTLSVLLMIATPVVVAVLLRRRFTTPWFLFLVGSATFIGSQIVHIPLNEWLADIELLPATGSLTGPPLWRTSLILGLTAGLCEELARTVGYALLRRFRRFEHGVMLGVGHGGIEAMVFGAVQTAAMITSLLALQSTDLTTLNLAADQMVALTQQLERLNSSPLWAALPWLERCLAMTIHVMLSVLVWQAFAQRKAWYVPLAIVYHAAFDAIAVYVGQQTESVLILYGVELLILAPGLIWLWRVWQKEAGPRPVTSSLRAEWRSFAAATRKELLQQWRTKRVIVVAAVFAFIGLASPLFAKFTPEIIRAVPGAEQFADLIPEPSVADVMTQYVKNLTQFGFMIAVLLGMGAIAGEKEKGTAALILCKPMPRWAFVCSKFVAQTLLYIAGFFIATLCTLYYTWFLFGPVDVGAFFFSNLLLLAWFMTYVAVTLTGSTLTKSVGAAAGVGLGGAVLLMLAGNLPMFGPLMPGALVAWASQLGLGTSSDPVTANGGAVAMALVIVVMCVLGAIAAFERQEL
ncbi:MAG TPA: YhfC family glutamic-type intramembrane protease [Anaerolineae bacterium]|nr:YhfC family glutamic-type intramembrane protease [Anaerolineae bacterium]